MPRYWCLLYLVMVGGASFPSLSHSKLAYQHSYPHVIFWYHQHALILCIVCYLSYCWQYTSHKSWLQIPTSSISTWVLSEKKRCLDSPAKGPAQPHIHNFLLFSMCMKLTCSFGSIFPDSLAISSSSSHVNCLLYLPTWMHQEYL